MPTVTERKRSHSGSRRRHSHHTPNCLSKKNRPKVLAARARALYNEGFKYGEISRLLDINLDEVKAMIKGRTATRKAPKKKPEERMDERSIRAGFKKYRTSHGFSIDTISVQSAATIQLSMSEMEIMDEVESDPSPTVPPLRQPSQDPASFDIAMLRERHGFPSEWKPPPSGPNSPTARVDTPFSEAKTLDFGGVKFDPATEKREFSRGVRRNHICEAENESMSSLGKSSSCGSIISRRSIDELARFKTHTQSRSRSRSVDYTTDTDTFDTMTAISVLTATDRTDMDGTSAGEESDVGSADVVVVAVNVLAGLNEDDEPTEQSSKSGTSSEERTQRGPGPATRFIETTAGATKSLLKKITGLFNSCTKERIAPIPPPPPRSTRHRRRSRTGGRHARPRRARSRSM